MKRLGYVVGIVWPADGQEWLLHHRELCSLHPKAKESHATLYPTVEQAEAVRKTLTWSEEYKSFVRPYYHYSRKKRKESV